MWIRLQNSGEFTHLTQRELLTHVLVQDGSSAFSVLEINRLHMGSPEFREGREKGRITKDNFMARPGGG